MKVREIMTSEAQSIGPDASLSAAASLMRDLDVGALPVCDHDRLAGMITDRDLAIRGVAEARDPAGTPVRAVMSEEIIYAFEDQEVADAARLMESRQVRRLPVLNRDKMLVGIVSLGDIASEAGPALAGEALQEISHPIPAQAAEPAITYTRHPASRRAVFRPARQIKGFSLQARDGEIGHVRDLYFDDLHWQVRYFVVETGNWLTHRLVLIAPESVQAPDWERHRLPVALSRDEVRHSPDWDSQRPVSRQYEIALRQHYQWQPYWGSIYGDATTGLAPIAGSPSVAQAAGEIDKELEGDPHLFSLNAVVGHHVQATDGEIGHVEDLLVDDERWVIRYLVVDTRNWWPGKRVILSPWWASEMNWPLRRIAMDLSRQAIKSSPPYDPKRTLTSEEAGALHEHYGRKHLPNEEVADTIVRSDNPNAS